MRRLARLIVSAVLLLGTLAAFGQQGNIAGLVVDRATGEPVPGANVINASDNSGVATDIDGRFTINNISLPATLRVSFLGYVAREVTAKTSTESLVIELDEEQHSLNEVVAVGYGTQRRTQLTGSVTKVGAEAFDRTQSATIDGALSGMVAGLNVTQASGQPGASASIRIRGGNSVNASNEPLYVIDGFIYYKDASAAKTGLGAIESSLNPLSTINPQDIESIEVLKDISATAIYGSRGANGVILVTTKKGRRGEAVVNYRFTCGVDIASKQLDLMNATEWAGFQKTYFYNKGGYTDDEIALLGEGTDWQDAMLRRALRYSHDISISGGNDHNRYNFSASYSNQEGIVLNSDFVRYNLHVGADWNIFQCLDFGLTTTYGKSRQNGLTTTEEVTYNSSPYSAGITNSFVYGLLMPPVVDIYDESGDYNYSNPYEYAYFAIGDHAANPISDLENSVAESINQYLLSNVWLRYTIGCFTLKATVGLNREQITQNYFSPSYTSLGLANEGVGGIGNKTNEVWQQEYTIGYTRPIGDLHEVDALAGYTRQTTESTYNSVLVTHFTNESLKQYNLADGSTIYPPESGHSTSELNSLIFRVNYTLLERYNATVTLRADNSSRFATSHRWGYFPSVGLSWNIDREGFMASLPAISGLKLRASWGIVGNQEIGDYEYSVSYSASQYAGSSSYSKTNAVNDDLKWEETTSYNIGLDLSLWSNRLSLAADAYYKKTSDLLLEVPTGYSTGVSSQLQNVGNVENKGLELSLTGQILKRTDLQWTATVNLAHNHNEITDMGSSSDIILGSANEQILRVGESLGSFYGLQFDGIVTTDEDVSLLPTVNSSTPQPGDVKYVDTNGDGKINSKDRVVLGSYQPTLTAGLQTSLSWRGLDASLQFAATVGNEVYSALIRRLEQTSDMYNLLSDVLDSWTEDNQTQRYAYASRDRTMSYIDSRNVNNASYLKLRNITIGWTWNIRTPHPFSVRLFATGSNLLTITGYKGYDPEVSSGTDTGAYPSARTLAGGIDIKF